MNKNILVVGSSNTDLIIKVGTIPRPGETVMGSSFSTFAGGKGANQAVAAARANGAVTFICALGTDDMGTASLALYEKENINTDYVYKTGESPSGVAMILVEESGENCIAVAPGANTYISPDYIESLSKLIKSSDILLTQLETPIETVEKLAVLAKKFDKKLIINPAPAQKLSDSILDGLYCITPNETEAEILSGVKVDSLESATEAASQLFGKGIKNVIVTLGSDGALLCNKQGVKHFPAIKVKAVDTTAAGDTFNGVLTAILAAGKELEHAVEKAVKAATLSVQKEGAINSIPYSKDY
ncbi:MAG: ribokinase [Lentisphaeraceae bacterium]|nr:ribokinase [Lentisphaeraceae bacterium]